MVGAELESRALTLPERARGMIITDQSDYLAAAEFLRGVTALRKEIVEHHAPLKLATHEAHRRAVEAERRVLAPVAEAEAAVKQTISRYHVKQESARREEQARLEREAQKRGEDDRQQAAMQAIDSGADEETVSAIAESPICLAPVVAPSAPRAAGVSGRELWTAEVTDLLELVKAVASGAVPFLAVQANTAFINQQARSLKSLMRYPGVRVLRSIGVSVRTK